MNDFHGTSSALATNYSICVAGEKNWLILVKIRFIMLIKRRCFEDFDGRTEGRYTQKNSKHDSFRWGSHHVDH